MVQQLVILVNNQKQIELTYLIKKEVFKSKTIIVNIGKNYKLKLYFVCKYCLVTNIDILF